MPRLVNKLPKYSLHKPAVQARVKYNGKTIYLGKYGSQESRKPTLGSSRIFPSRKSRDDRRAAPGASLLVGEIVLRFFDHAKGYYVRNGVPTGEHVTIRCCLRPLTKRFGELPAREFGPKRLKLVREDMIKLGWSGGTSTRRSASSSGASRWAASEELVPGESPWPSAPSRGSRRTARTHGRKIRSVRSPMNRLTRSCLTSLSWSPMSSGPCG